MQDPSFMKTKPRFATLLAVLFASAPLLSAGEVERLRALVAEQEMQIQQLELKIAQLSVSSAPVSAPAAPESTPTRSEINSSAAEIPPTPVSDKGLVPTAETCPEPATTDNPATYTVQAGDNMVKIARKHGTTSAILNELNGLKKDGIIRPGQKLKLPASASVAASDDAPVPVATPVEIEVPAAPAPSTVKHTVTSGETFYSIAKKHNVTSDALVKENPSINPNTLRVGQVVQIPNKPKTTDLSPVPAPDQTASLSSYNNIPVSSHTGTVTQSRAADKPVKITEEISYSDFAKKYNTTTSRLDKLNGLRLDPTTVLAKGSELYIPEQR